MTHLVWTLIRRVYLVPAVLVFAAAFSWSAQTFGWRYGVWTSTSFFAYAALEIAGPVMVGGAAWAAWRLSAKSTVISLPSVPRSESAVGLHLGSGILALGGGYALGLLPIFVLTALTATHGYPGPLQVLAGGVITIALLCVGYGIGRMLPWMLTPPLTAAVAFFAISIASFGRPWIAMTPSRGGQVPTVPWIIEDTPALLAMTAFYALLGIAAVWTGVVVIRMHRSSSWIRRPIAGAIMALPLLLIPVFAAWDPPIQKDLTAEHLPSPECTPRPAAEVCVHPGLRSDLEPVADAVQELMDWYGGRLPSNVTGFGAGLGAGDDGSGRLKFGVYPNVPVDYSVPRLAPTLAGVDACMEKFPDEAGSRDFADELPEQLAVSAAIESWLQVRTGSTDIGTARQWGPEAALLAGRLEGVSDDQVSNWIRDHRDELFSCTATAEGLL